MEEIITMEALNKLKKDVKQAAKTLSGQEARYLVDTYYQIQEYRKRTVNQCRKLDTTPEGEPNSTLQFFSENFDIMERNMKSTLKSYVESQPIGVWLTSICGIGEVISAGLIAHIDIKKVQTAGQIWAFAGLDPTKEWKNGEVRPWNAKLKTLCCHPDTLIRMKNGYKKIKDIEIGDYVLTHKGNYKKVTKTFVNSCENNQLIQLSLAGHGMSPLMITDYHPVYVKKTKVYNMVRNRNGNYICGFRRSVPKNYKVSSDDAEQIKTLYNSGKTITEIANIYNISMAYVSKIINGKTKIEKRFKEEIGWIKAREIKGGYLGLSVNSLDFKDDIDYVELKAQNYVFNETGEIASSGRWRDTKSPKSVFFNPKVEITPDVLRFFGLFIAEGHTSKNTIGFSYNENEKEYIDFTEKMIKKLFNQIPNKAYNKENHCVQVTFVNKIVAENFRNWFGVGSHNKKIPDFLLNIKQNKIKNLLKGMFEGDGTISEKSVQYTTVSNKLALQVYDIFTSLGISTRLYQSEKYNKITVNDYSTFYNLVFDKKVEYKKANKCFKEKSDAGSWYSFRMPKTVSYEGNVYNIEVEDDNSYIANGIAVHNCWKIGESFVKVSNNDKDIYGKIYRERKAYESAKNEAGGYAEQAKIKLEKFKIGKDTEAYKWYSQGKLPPAHIHERAKRYAVKIFLSHLFDVWYRLENGCEPPKPFAIAILGYAHMIDPPNQDLLK